MKIIEKILDLESGEETIIEREETKAETAERLRIEKEIAAKQEEQMAIEAAKASAESKLVALGLTAEEIAAFRG